MNRYAYSRLTRPITLGKSLGGKNNGILYWDGRPNRRSAHEQPVHFSDDTWCRSSIPTEALVQLAEADAFCPH